MFLQNLAVQRGQWLSFLCCYVVCEMEKTICPLPRLRFILNSIKNVHAPMKPQNLISAAREYFAKDYLWIVFSRNFVMKPIGLFKRGGGVPKSFYFEKPIETMSSFWSAFQSTLLQHAGEVFFVLGNTDFFKLKNASELTRKCFAHRSFIQGANNASWLINHFDVAYCYRIYSLSASSDRHAVLWKFYVCWQKRKFGTVVNIRLTQKFANYEKLKNIKTWQ